MEFPMILLIVGAALMAFGWIPAIGTSKAERLGKAAVSDAKKRRIRISNILTAAGFVICLAGLLLTGR